MNKHKPWENLGIDEVAYWKFRCIELEQENEKLRITLASTRKRMEVAQDAIAAWLEKNGK